MDKSYYPNFLVLVFNQLFFENVHNYNLGGIALIHLLKIFFSMLWLFIAINGCVHLKPFQQIQSSVEKLKIELDQIFNEPAFSNAYWGVVIQSLKNGEYLYCRNAHKNFIPASNMKLFTTAAALVKLGPEYRYCTKFYTNGSIDENGVLQGDLIISGSGDPTITGRYYNGEITKPLDFWADSLKARNITSIAGNIIGDDNYFEEEIMGEGWAWDYQSDWYAAQISALSFNDNCINIYIVAGDTVGYPAKYQLVPETDYAQIVNKVSTVRNGLEKEIMFKRKRGTNLVEIEGAIAIDSPPRRDWFSVENPTLFIITVFKQALENKGIQVSGIPQDIDDLEQYTYQNNHANLIFRYFSPPLWEIVEITNKVSQNLYTELLLRTIGAYFRDVGDAQHGIEVVKEFLQDIGIDTDQFLMYDGSGLSRLNMITPTHVVKLLRFMRKHAYGDYFYKSLPIAGVDGTLKNRMQQTAAQENVRAKTGYVGHVRALSGYVTTVDNEELAFSIIANNYSVPTSMANLIQDLVCERLANFSRFK
jgi:D-alanyl-D-alanine carboxypeptidase/D-alanyl-D-alanine-endopeptidase (penicillin-binding protein 4)